jgi:quercetin dioxygenase-like cupin family protein
MNSGLHLFSTTKSFLKGLSMPAIVNTVDTSAELFVLGETLRPLLTNAMGSNIEVFDTRGPAEAGPPPHHHPWEEIYVVLEGELEVNVDGKLHSLKAGGAAHVPANTIHGYRNITNAHFLTIVGKGNATKFFTEVAAEVTMSPPDIPGVIRVAAENDIQFVI